MVSFRKKAKVAITTSQLSLFDSLVETLTQPSLQTEKYQVDLTVESLSPPVKTFFSIGENPFPKTERERILANIDAIRLLISLTNGHSKPSSQEQQILARFSGWGAIAQLWDNEKLAQSQANKGDESVIRWWNKYGQYRQQFETLLSSDEKEQAALSTLSSYYTPIHVIKAIWKAIEQFGFTGGRILEPSAGIGNFIGAMPEKIRTRSTITAVEKDIVSGRILEVLYPDCETIIAPFEETTLERGAFDLVIGNIPFGGFSVFDRGNTDLSRFKIHNYFIGRSLRVVREGGIAALITTTGTMDSQTEDFRTLLAEQENAELIGAIRLPSCTFEKDAGTEVTTDILFFKKREGVVRQFAQNTYRHVVTIKTEQTSEDLNEEDAIRTLNINEFFVKRPEMMLGFMTWADTVKKGGLYRANAQTLYCAEPETLPEQLIECISYLPASIFHRTTTSPLSPINIAKEKRFIESVKIKGRLYSQNIIIREYERLKTAFKSLLDAERQQEPDWKVDELRQELNQIYDWFVVHFGTLNKNRHIRFIEEFDSQFTTVQALEFVADSVITKSDIFRERVYSISRLPEINTASDALTLSLAHFGHVNLPQMSVWLNRPYADIDCELRRLNLLFTDPINGICIDRDSYLSGNVRLKLEQAELAVKENPVYMSNVKALTEVIPNRIPLSLIGFTMSSSWLPPKAVKSFIEETLQLKVQVGYNTKAAKFEVVCDSPNSTQNRVMGTKKRTALELIEYALNAQTIVITRTLIIDGNEVQVKDPEETSAAIQAQENLQEIFIEYIRANFGEEVESIYNELHNSHIPKKYRKPPFSHYPGANQSITLRGHQYRGVSRIIEQDTMLGHDVGTGKTFTMISGAMELKRLGLAHKALFAVQNSTVKDFANAFRLLYPSALLYVPEKVDLSAENRKRFLQRIATNNFDAIIIPQSFLKLIPDDPTQEQAFINSEISRAVACASAGERLAGRNSKKKNVKKLNELKLSVESKLKRQANRLKDDILTFDKLGIDALFLDEAHRYKRLGFFTNRTRVKGIDTQGSQDAMSTMLKVRNVQNRQGRVVLATGTPVSNTMAEVWTMLRYIAPTRLKDAKITTFDEFAGVFGQIISSFELTTSGNFKAVDRFARFINVKQLSELYRSHVDVVLNDDVEEFKQDNTLPTLKSQSVTINKENGTVSTSIEPGFTRIIIPQTDGVSYELERIKNELRWYESLSGKDKKENSHIPLVMFGQAKKATLDIRLLDPSAQDEPDSKGARAVAEIIRIYRESNTYKGTQLVFADIFQSPEYNATETDETCSQRIRKGVRFNLFNDLTAKLIKAGIPGNEIAITPEDPAKREIVFEAVRKGEIRIMFGSSERMGVGVNVQQLLVAIHHLDAPNRPTDFQQRNGRIIRQGNLHAVWGKCVEILTYGVEKTLDATAYGRLAVKQKFINQVLKGDVTDDSMSDIDADSDFTAMSFDQMMATLSGSKYALLYTAKKLEQTRLLQRHRNWKRGLIDAQYYADKATRDMSKSLALLPIAQQEAEILKATFNAPHYTINSVEIDGVAYSDKYGKPLQEVCNRIIKSLKKGKKQTETIQINGTSFTLTGYQQMIIDGEEMGITYHWGKIIEGTGINAHSLLASIRYSILNAYDLPDDINRAITLAKSQFTEWNKKVNQPFRYSQELEKIENQLADLKMKLEMESI